MFIVSQNSHLNISGDFTAFFLHFAVAVKEKLLIQSLEISLHV